MNKYQRFWYTFLLTILPGGGRDVARFIRKHHLFGSIGRNCLIQQRKLPLYSNLIHLGNNVIVASHVGFVTHDFIHSMLNKKYGVKDFVERVGCIKIGDNVFIGSGTRVLYDTVIGNNVIIGSDSLVNKDIPDNSVYAGVPARYICSFDDYVEKVRLYSSAFRSAFPDVEASLRGVVNDSLAISLYEDFLSRHHC